MPTVFAATKFDKFVDSLAQKKIDLDSDTFKAMMLASYTPAAATHQYVSDVKGAGTEATGTGYTAGGCTLTSVSWTLSGGVWKWTATIPGWDASAGSLAGRYVVFYDSTPGTDATNPVICYWDLANNTTVTATAGTFTLTAHATDGIVKFS